MPVAERFPQIASDLREQVLQGRLQPGQRIPTRQELRARYQASPGTVQKALDILQREGFMVSRGRAGTFVAPEPPSRGCIGLLYNGLRDDIKRSRYDLALEISAGRIAKSQAIRFESFYGFSQGLNSPDLARLTEFACAGRLAGLILSRPFPALSEQPFMQNTDLPKVGLYAWDCHPGVPRILHQPIRDKVLDRLAAQGCRAAGMVFSATGPTPAPNPFLLDWQKAALARGIRIEPHWCIPCHPDAPQGAQLAVNLLMRTEDRPPVLIVVDDNLATACGVGALESGRYAPGGLSMVVQANFPVPPEVATPVYYIGVDFVQQMQQALELLDRQTRGETVPAQSEIGSVWEDELPGDLRAALGRHGATFESASASA